MSFPDGRTVGGTAVYRLEYLRRDHWTLILVSDDLGTPALGEGKACRNGTYGSISANGAFRGGSSDQGFCNGVSRWIHPGIACCYRWKKEIATGLVTEGGMPSVLWAAGPRKRTASVRSTVGVELV